MNPNPQSNQITLFCQTLTLLFYLSESECRHPQHNHIHITSHSLASFSPVYKLLHRHTTYNTTPLDYFDTAYTISSSPSSPKPSSKTSSNNGRSHVKRLTIRDKLLIFHALTQYQSGHTIDILSLYLIIFSFGIPFSYSRTTTSLHRSPS